MKYFCKCGRTFEKESKALWTGYTETETCTGCPYLIKEQGEKTKCCASQKLDYGTRISGDRTGKNALFLSTLDLDFIERCGAWVHQRYSRNELNFSSSTDDLRACDYNDCGRIRIGIYPAKNTSGVMAKLAFISEFFNADGFRKDLDEEEEEHKMKLDIETKIIHEGIEKSLAAPAVSGSEHGQEQDHGDGGSDHDQEQTDHKNNGSDHDQEQTDHSDNGSDHGVNAAGSSGSKPKMAESGAEEKAAAEIRSDTIPADENDDPDEQERFDACLCRTCTRDGCHDRCHGATGSRGLCDDCYGPGAEIDDDTGMPDCERYLPEGEQTWITIGACRFCGQMMQIKEGIASTQSAADKYVSEQCGCTGSRIARSEQEAEVKISALFGGADETVIKHLNGLAGDTLRQLIRTVSVRLSDDVTCKISLDSKGYLRITRTQTNTQLEMI